MENRTFNWDDEISKESTGGFILLPEGTYDFTVLGYERKWYNGGVKLPACNQAVVNIQIQTNEGMAQIKTNMFLHSSCEGILCSFFTCIGLRKYGEAFKMRWNDIAGKKGKCKIGVRTYTGTDGQEKKSNEVKSWIEPAQKTYTAGAF